jgi:hypothetical protein
MIESTPQELKTNVKKQRCEITKKWNKMWHQRLEKQKMRKTSKHETDVKTKTWKRCEYERCENQRRENKDVKNKHVETRRWNKQVKNKGLEKQICSRTTVCLCFVCAVYPCDRSSREQRKKGGANVLNERNKTIRHNSSQQGSVQQLPTRAMKRAVIRVVLVV